MIDATAPSPAPPSQPKGDRRWGVAVRWWQGLQPLRPDGKPNPFVNRGALARLRRAAILSDIMDEEAVFALHRELGYGRARAGETLVPVAIVASALAHVREHDPARKPARAVGRATFGDRDLESAALSPLRLRRLLQAREPDDVLRQMRRMVSLAERRLDVGALATLILDWFDPSRGDQVRTQFAYDYYAAGGDPPGSPAPAA